MITPAEIAKQLIAAERERVAIAPFTDANPELDVATAYLAQRAFVQAKLDAGERVVGAKLGLTSKVKQQAMGVDAPLSGVVTSGMLAPFGVPIELSEFIHPRVEPEIAFVLARDVAAPATVSSVLAATESVYGAIDVLDSRYEDFRFALPDVIADNASAARFLVGPRSVAPGDLEDLRLLGCVLRADGDCRRDGGRGGGHGASGGLRRLAGKSVGRAGRGAEGRMDRILRRLDGTHPALGGILCHRRVRRAGHDRGIHRIGTRVVHTARKDPRLSRFGVALMPRAVIISRCGERFRGPGTRWPVAEKGSDKPRSAHP